MNGLGSIGASMGAIGGAASAFGGSTVGKGFLGAIGGGLGREVMGLFGKGKGKGKTATGCSCTTQPEMSCEQKCMYGRYMNEKCKGCSGKPMSKCGPRTRGSYSSAPKKGSYKSGYKGRPKGRQDRLAYRDYKKSVKHPKRSERKDIGGPKWGKRR